MLKLLTINFFIILTTIYLVGIFLLNPYKNPCYGVIGCIDPIVLLGAGWVILFPIIIFLALIPTFIMDYKNPKITPGQEKVLMIILLSIVAYVAWLLFSL